jgi:tetratricopeptide (TPR) repeat protein
MNRRFIASLMFAVAFTTLVTGQAPMAASDPDALIEAGTQAYRMRNYKEAAEQFRAAAKADPTSITAQVGLVRSDINAGVLVEATQIAEALVKSYPNSAAAHAAMGDVAFRRSMMPEAEKEYLGAIRLDKTEGRAYYGLAILYSAYSLHRRAYDFFTIAHAYSPSDPDIENSWLYRLPRKQRLAEFEKLAATSGLDKTTSENYKLAIQQIKAVDNLPAHACKLAAPVERAEIHLQPLMYNAKILREWGLRVGVNDHFSSLVLDTGAGGITLSSKAAAKAGVVKLADTRVRGIGDQGVANPYVGYAKTIKIGGLEFHDCIVDVIDTNRWLDVDGLIGTDVFAKYIVDIDFPVETMRLLPLPKDPEAGGEVAGLDSHEQPSDVDSESTDPKVIRSRYHDRYVAPEMQKWSRFYRSGHMILLPTFVNHKPEHLFLVDTGASRNLLSNNFAQEITSVSKDNFGRIGGISGEVKDVYTARKAEMQFANFKTKDFDLTTIDLSGISESAGTEVSGIIGFELLRMLEMKIDYRDGLIDFTFDRDKLEIKNLNNLKSFLDMH